MRKMTVGVDTAGWVATMEDSLGNSARVKMSGDAAPHENPDSLREMRQEIATAVITGREVSFTWEVCGVKYPGLRVTRIEWENY